MTGIGAMLAILWRAQRRRLVVWVIATVGTLAFTAAAVSQIYNTPEEIASYGQAVVSDALIAINGHVEGIDTLGGIIQDEFGFIASFLMPLVGLTLVAGMTRREEDSGRLEALLAGRIDRQVPVVSALVLVGAVVVVMDVGFVLSLLAAGIEVGPAVLYALALGMVTVVFAALAAVLAQIVLHSKGIYALGFAAVGLSYILRGVGDVNDTFWVWLSPLGWLEKTAPFGADQRWWVLLIPVVVATGLSVFAVGLAKRRDLGGGAVPPRTRSTCGLVLARPTRWPGAAWAAWIVPRVAGRIGRTGRDHGRAGATNRRCHPRQPIAERRDGDHSAECRRRVPRVDPGLPRDHRLRLRRPGARLTATRGGGRPP
jgi:ABC-2 type transport system permease protein